MEEKDREIFINSINENRLKMYKTAIAILKNEDDANDAIQDALYSAYKNYDSLKEKSYFTTWIIRILINKCYDIINKNKKIAYIDDSITENTTGVEDNYEVESSLEWVLNKIDKDLKEIVVLYYYDELPVGDIAEILEIPQGTVKSRLSRAREQIRKIMKKEEGEFDG
ncbi:MAG: sigma-70 family RNA polymerase sigma factor [Clostridia bacterium]|nr:sigma-70 family RNA polymerase sigma factor [Clostridia bacterium]